MKLHRYDDLVFLECGAQSKNSKYVMDPCVNVCGTCFTSAARRIHNSISFFDPHNNVKYIYMHSSGILHHAP